MEQARHSAALNFSDFAWDQTIGGTGWLLNLTKDGVLLDNGSGLSGEDVEPYLAASDNDTADYDSSKEVYVLPGSGYGATASQRPAGIPENSFAETGSCASNILKVDQEDSTCSLTVTGRPDLSISISAPAGVYHAPGDTMDMSVSATNLGPGTVQTSDGFAITVSVPAGWTASPVPGCTVSGQTVSCAIDTPLSPAPVPGGSGGNIGFTIPLVANSDAVSGSYPLVASLDRSVSDGDTDPTNDDFVLSNDQAQGTVQFVKLPRLTLRKTTLDDVGSFTFTGNNGWETQTITTVSQGVAQPGATQILAEVDVQTVISETLPPNWVLDDVVCLGMGTGGTVSFDENSFTLSPEAVAVDIAVDPLECTNNCARNEPDALAVMAAAPRGALLHAPDCYMNKIAGPPELAGHVSLDAPVADNLAAAADVLGKPLSEVRVIVLERSRHERLIAEIRAAGARLWLIGDGDIAGALRAATGEADLLMGIGAAPEGVIAATALRGIGGVFEGRLHFHEPEFRARAVEMLGDDVDRLWQRDELCTSDDAVFVATGVCDGWLPGPKAGEGGMVTTSRVISVADGRDEVIQREHAPIS